MVRASGDSRLPLHPAWTHLPMAFLGATSLWDLLAVCNVGNMRATWSTVAFWNLALGLAASLPAVVTGVLDYLRLPGDETLLARAGRHMLWVGGALVCYLTSQLLRMGDPPPGLENEGVGWETITASIGMMLLLVGGHSGGDLAYRSAKRAGEREKKL